MNQNNEFDMSKLSGLLEDLHYFDVLVYIHKEIMAKLCKYFPKSNPVLNTHSENNAMGITISLGKVIITTVLLPENPLTINLSVYYSPEDDYIVDNVTVHKTIIPSDNHQQSLQALSDALDIYEVKLKGILNKALKKLFKKYS